MEIRIETAGHWPDAVAALLRDLPEWFGIEESVHAYIEADRLQVELARRVRIANGQCEVTEQHIGKDSEAS